VQPHTHGTKQGDATQSEAEPKTQNPLTGLKTGLNQSAEGWARLRIGVRPESRVATYALDRHMDALPGKGQRRAPGAPPR
jgi:hypothetical protein